MIQLHEADEHAPFRHYTITINEIVRMRVSEPGHRHKEPQEMTLEAFYVVCYFCGHWIQRVVDRCKCPASCHAEVLALQPTRRYPERTVSI